MNFPLVRIHFGIEEWRDLRSSTICVGLTIDLMLRLDEHVSERLCGWN